MKHRIIFLVVFVFLLLSFTSVYASNDSVAINPGFEDGSGSDVYFWTTEAWDNGAGKTEFKWDDQQKHSGNKSISITNSSPNDSRYTQLIKSKSNSSYKISCWIKTENVGTDQKGANISIKNLTDTSLDIKGTSDDWKYIELYGKTNDTQTDFIVTLGLGGYGSLNTGKAWFDDFEVQELSSIPADKTFINLFKGNTANGSNTDNNGNTWVWPLSLIILIAALIAFLIIKSRKVGNTSEGRGITTTKANLSEPGGSWLKLDRKDVILMVSMTLIYLVIALINLGSTNVPKTSWEPTKPGESFILDLGKSVNLTRVYYYNGLGEGKYRFEYLDNTGKYAPLVSAEIRDVFSWKFNSVSAQTSKIKVIVEKPGVVLNEIGLFADGSKTALTNIKIVDKNVDPGDKGKVENLIDEQNTIEYKHSFMTGTYFDEIYHARTAFEQLNHIEPFETTHPPLGKILISIGIMIFGMDPFGWRIIGTLFGAAMIPLMYMFGKKMFSHRLYGFCAAFLIMFDFMHFVQTRIATIDVYGTFFVILMYYFMYDYFINKSYLLGLKKSLTPLFLSGLFFGLGAASKWIALYGAGGLALLFFIAKYLEYMDYEKVLHKKIKAKWVKDFIPYYIGMTFLWCSIFFIVIPGIIYILSYIPFMMVKGPHHGLSDIVNYQTFMFNYHKNLIADHPFASKWWTWPLDLKPMWYYAGSDLAPGMASSITAMGNPAIWWLGVLAIPASAVISFIKRDKRMLVVFIAILFQYVPWMLVSRLTFIYHFFSTVPFMILSIVYLIKCAVDKVPETKYLVYFYLAIVLLLFIAFYPVLSGMEVHKSYIDTFLIWFKGHWIF